MANVWRCLDCGHTEPAALECEPGDWEACPECEDGTVRVESERAARKRPRKRKAKAS